MCGKATKLQEEVSLLVVLDDSVVDPQLVKPGQGVQRVGALWPGCVLPRWLGPLQHMNSFDGAKAPVSARPCSACISGRAFSKTRQDARELHKPCSEEGTGCAALLSA